MRPLIPAPSPSSPDVAPGGADAPIECPNCGRSFAGEYCPSCGQEAEDPKRPIGALLRGLAADVLGVDSRMWRTLGALVRKPGFLTREYFAGRRARYMLPLRLYVLAAIAFFGVMAVTGGGPLRVRVETSSDRTTLTFGQGEGQSGGRLDLPPPGSANEETGRFSRWLSERVARVRERPDDFNAAVFATLSNVHFLLLPIFALLLKLFWRRPYYVEHLVFAVHAQAFLLLIGSVFVVVAVGGGTLVPDRVASSAAWLVLTVYLYLAARRAYGGRWWTTLLKVLAFGWLYAIAETFVIVLVAAATLAFF
jgi:uncharacterized protein DUF3667